MQESCWVSFRVERSVPFESKIRTLTFLPVYPKCILSSAYVTSDVLFTPSGSVDSTALRAGLLTAGSVEQDEQMYLDDRQVR